MSNIERFVALTVVVIIGIVGCSKLPGPTGPGPAVDSIPDQETSTGVELQLDLVTYVENPGDQTLTWEVLVGEGEIDGGIYTGTFNEAGCADVTFRVTNADGKFADADFAVVALYGYMAIVQYGNGLGILDGGTGTIDPIQEGSNVPLVYRDLLADGSVVYERLGGSSVDLFVYDHAESRQIGQSAGFNTVYDSHTSDGKLFYEEGNASETGLYMWDADTENVSTIAWRAGMHNRNAFFAPPEMVYFEYGNNGQADINYWRVGDNGSATAYSSIHPEEIKAVLPDGGIVFATKGLGGEDELRYFRANHGLFDVGGDLSPAIQAQDMHFVATSSQGLVIFETGTTSRDLWVWSSTGLSTKQVAAGSEDERFVTLTNDDLIIYSVAAAPGNNDLKIYNYSADASTDIGVSAADEVFEFALSDSDVIFAVDDSTSRSLYRYDAASSSVETIAESVGDTHAAVALLRNDRLVFSSTGAANGLFTWNPTTGTVLQAGGPDATFAGEGPSGGFLMHVDVQGQTDLELWDGTTGAVVVIAQSPEDDRYEAAFGNDVIVYSTVVPPKTTADLFEWRDGSTTRMTDSQVSHSVVRVLRVDG